VVGFLSIFKRKKTAETEQPKAGGETPTQPAAVERGNLTVGERHDASFGGATRMLDQEEGATSGEQKA